MRNSSLVDFLQSSTFCATVFKLAIEAITYTSWGGQGVWELLKVNGSVAWGQYMQIASQSEAAIYGKPMVYVNFVHRAPGNLDDAGASGRGQPQAMREDGRTECTGSMQRCHSP